MSLESAVLDIAESMEAETILKQGDVLRSYAKMLRLAVRAAEGTAPAVSIPVPTCKRCHATWKGEGPLCPACQGDKVKLKELGEKRKAEAPADVEEEIGGRVAVILDGPLYVKGQETTFPLPPGMPVSTLDAPAYTMIGDHRYKLIEKGLRYAPARILSTIKTLPTEGGVLLGKV